MGWYLFALVTLAALVTGEETCLSSDEEPYLYFGTKTAYAFVNKGLANNRAHEVAGCQPIAIWLMQRHGSHNPEANEMDGLRRLLDLQKAIISNYQSGNFRNTNERMCNSDVNLLERWQWSSLKNETFAGYLTSEGYMSAQQLAQAWRQKFPTLLTDNRHDYLFKYEDDPVSATTFRAFTEGLFRAQAEGYGIPKMNDVKLIKPYKSCPMWSRDVEESNDTLSQLHIFENKQEYKDMITTISKRIGFNYDVNRETIRDMYLMCRYNKAWDVNHISPWCAAFSKEDLQRLEYAEDLQSYYKYGYGSQLNKKIGCSTVKDMMDFFKKHIDNPEIPQHPRTQIHLTDAAMLLFTHASLGAHRSTVPLTGDNYRTPQVQIQNRKWTTSNMAPYNANLAAVLFSCTPSSHFTPRDQYQVLFLENQQLLYLDDCRVGLCDWTVMQQKYASVADNCDLQFCNASQRVNGCIGAILAVIGVLRLIY